MSMNFHGGRYQKQAAPSVFVSAQDREALEAFDVIRRGLKREADANQRVAQDMVQIAMRQQHMREVAERRTNRLILLCGVLAVLAAWGWAR